VFSSMPKSFACFFLRFSRAVNLPGHFSSKNFSCAGEIFCQFFGHCHILYEYRQGLVLRPQFDGKIFQSPFCPWRWPASRRLCRWAQSRAAAIDYLCRRFYRCLKIIFCQRHYSIYQFYPFAPQYIVLFWPFLVPPPDHRNLRHERWRHHKLVF